MLQYAVFRKRPYFNWICKVAMLLSTLCAIGGVILIWVLYPKSYNYSDVSDWWRGRNLAAAAVPEAGQGMSCTHAMGI